MDYYDRQYVERKLNEVSEKASREVAQLRKETRDGFNRVAAALEALTAEVKGLRADLNPKLDKPKKLQAPGQGAG